MMTARDPSTTRVFWWVYRYFGEDQVTLTAWEPKYE